MRGIAAAGNVNARPGRVTRNAIGVSPNDEGMYAAMLGAHRVTPSHLRRMSAGRLVVRSLLVMVLHLADGERSTHV
ncbi:hypothetical protein GCM10010532_089380 [Dactylosporangium siamense]|uniref:Uncharacterized protein n=1 Tax=Dactylosporangium siamense TaxID=685454 RepID=A0A919UBM7_9ACTN|nr:hypothetical protein Dsi01nite_077000 [Dactylosporangium siamense]